MTNSPGIAPPDPSTADSNIAQINGATRIAVGQTMNSTMRVGIDRHCVDPVLIPGAGDSGIDAGVKEDRGDFKGGLPEPAGALRLRCGSS